VIKKKDLSQDDKKTWENFIKDPSGIYNKDKNNQTTVRKERFKFDLHGFTLNDANKKVKEILFFCIENNYKELLLITGKGMHSTSSEDVYISKDLGKLKFSVPEFIRSDLEINKLIISINEAEVKDGGDGAILIKLKNL
tara:strand:+ start:126 stop:542 length:417 start_codon:yes stop_codon:yes gene_type:complete